MGVSHIETFYAEFGLILLMILIALYGFICLIDLIPDKKKEESNVRQEAIEYLKEEGKWDGFPAVVVTKGERNMYQNMTPSERSKVQRRKLQEQSVRSQHGGFSRRSQLEQMVSRQSERIFKSSSNRSTTFVNNTFLYVDSSDCDRHSSSHDCHSNHSSSSGSSGCDGGGE